MKKPALLWLTTLFITAAVALSRTSADIGDNVNSATRRSRLST